MKVLSTLNPKNGGALPAGGTAAMAEKLAAPHTVRTNLASTEAAGFDGGSDIAPGVTGILSIPNGGTGSDNMHSLLYALCHVTFVEPGQTSDVNQMKTAGCWIAEGGDQGMFKNGPLNDQSNEITLGSVICFGPRKPRVSNKTQYSESYMMQIFIALSAIYMRSLHYANSSTNTTYSAWKQIA